jgi:hypothetical protein
MIPEDFNGFFKIPLSKTFKIYDKIKKSDDEPFVIHFYRRENESRIRGLKDKMVQDFIPKEIQGRELAGINQRKQQQDTEVGLDPRRLRRLPEDNEEAAVPSNLQQITRRLRQDINQ